MFEKRIPIFKLFGFEVRIDPSWIIIAFLVTWSLAKAVFPFYYKGLSQNVYWWMGIIGALGLFVSIIFHEFSHSIVARKFGLSMKGITLFIFGGVAEMEEEPPSAKAEFLMAIAGPLASIFLGFLFHFTSFIFIGSIAATGVLHYLRWINWILAAFNLLPAFPLDGGRVLRSALWKWKNNINWATRVSSQLGTGFGFFISFMGVVFIFSGAFIGGLWWILIGMFLQGASRASYQRLLLNETFKGETVKHFMKPEPVTVPSTISVKHLVEDYIYKYHYKMFPVVDDGKLLGAISTKDIKEIPREDWQDMNVNEVFKEVSENNTINPNDDAMTALSRINKTKNGRLLVADKEKLVGVITLKDLLSFFALKMDLEGNPAGIDSEEEQIE